MGKNKLKWLTLSQSSVFFASSLIFPFYILFVKNIGSSYTQFGFSYGLFGLSGALIYPLLGRLSERFDSRYFLLLNSWGWLFCFYMSRISEASFKCISSKCC